MSGGGTNNGLRKTLGALKDSTTVNLAKINSDYKDLDIAIVKATNHEEGPAKERRIRAVLAALSATRPRADVSYCIHGLARRLSRTHNWAVALKTLIVIHRALREVDLSFQEELVNYGRSQGHMLNMAHFKDDSSPDAWDYSTWVRSYALFLEERLECFRVLKYDIQMDQARTKDLDTPSLLEHLPALQQLLHRVLDCQPQGAATRNLVIQIALSLVASESIKIYNAISDGNVNLVDKFFEMKSVDALKALDIYRRAGLQAERLSDFNETIRNIVDVGRGERFMKIEQPPASFLQAMEEYVREAPRTSVARKDPVADNRPKEIPALENKPSSEEKEVPPPTPPLPAPEPEPEPQPVVERIDVETSRPDFLGLKEPSPAALELDEKNAMALAIVPVEQPNSTQPSLAPGATGWELALVSAPTANESTAVTRKLAGGLDQLTLDSLYNEAIQRNNQSSNPWEQASMGNTFAPQMAPHMLYASNAMAAPQPMQMAQQHGFIYPQHPQMMMVNQQPTANPFGNPFSAPGHPHGSFLPVQGYNPYPGLI